MTTITPEGLIEGHSFEGLVYEAKGTVPGDYKGVFTGKVIIKDQASNDVTNSYKINYEPGKLTITKATFTVEAVNYNGVYDGEAHNGGAEASVTEGTSIEYSVDGGETWTTEAPSIKDVGVVNYKVKATNPNYEDATADGKLEVTPKDVTVKADDKTKAYGEEDPELTATVTGTLGEDTVTYTLSREEGEDVGTYTITLAGDEEQGNYKVTYQTGNFTITKATFTVEAVNYNGVYDGEAHNGGATASVEDGTTIQYSVDGGETWTTEAPSIKDVGVVNYKVKATNPNYEDATADGTLTVTKRSVTLTSGDATKAYDGTALTNTEVTVGGDGFVEGEGATYKVTGSQTDVGSSDNTFTYTINEGTLETNYTITKTEGKLEVTKNETEIIITAKSADKKYDGTPLTNAEYTVTENILADGDVLTAVVEGTITDVGTVENKVTSYQVMRDEKDVTSNYTFGESVDGTLEVTPKDVTVKTGSAVKYYDGTALKNAEASITGLVNDETATVTATGSQTEVGNSKNTYEITWGTAKETNYTVKENLGILTVKKQKVVTEDPQDEDYVKVSFTTSKGSLEGTSEYWVLKDEEVSLTAPTVTGLTDYEFKAWDPEIKTTYSEDTVHKATFTYSGDDIVPQKPGEDKPDVPENFVKVEFLPGENGTIADTETTIYWVNPDAEKTLADVQKPRVNANKDYKFTGWDKEDTTAITGALEVTAQYKKKVVTENPNDEDYVKVSFETTKGKLEGTKEYWVLKDETVSLTAPTVNMGEITDYKFKEWDPAVKTTYSEDTVHKATFTYSGDDIVPQKPGEDKPDVPENFVKVEFLPGENGTIADTETTIYWVNPDAEKTLADVQKPRVNANKDYKFTGWDKEDTTAITEELTVTAQYKKKVVTEPDVDEPIIPWGPITEKTFTHQAYMYGYPDGSFGPNFNITRGEAAALISRLKGFSMNDNSRPNFTDMPERGWYHSAINAVVKHGLMRGYPDGSFRPDDKITRAEFAQMIKNIDSKNSATAPFADVKGHWAEPAIDQAYGNGRIKGYPDGSFRPDAPITRAEAVTIANSMFARKVDGHGLVDRLANSYMLKTFTDLNKDHWAYYEIMEATNSHEFVRRYKNETVENWLVIK